MSGRARTKRTGGAKRRGRTLVMPILLCLVLLGCGKAAGPAQTGNVTDAVAAADDAWDTAPAADTSQEMTGAESGQVGSADAEHAADGAVFSDLFLQKRTHFFFGDTYDQRIEWDLERISLGAEGAAANPALAQALDAWSDEMEQQLFMELSEQMEDFGADGEMLGTQKDRLLVRRADGQALSYVCRQEYSTGESDLFVSWEAHNFDPVTGRELALSDVIADKDALLAILVEKLRDHALLYGEDAAQAADRYTAQDILDNDILDNWTLDPQGITFYADAYSLFMEPFLLTVTFSEDADATLFVPAVRKSAPDDWIMALPFFVDQVLDCQDDGAPDTLHLSWWDDEDSGGIVYFYLNDAESSYAIAEGIMDPQAYLVHRSGASFVLLQYFGSGQEAESVVDVYRLTGNKVLLTDTKKAELSHADANAADRETETAVPFLVPTRTEHILLAQASGTACDAYAIDDSGRLVVTKEKVPFPEARASAGKEDGSGSEKASAATAGADTGIENNGGYFIRVGDEVWFRAQEPEDLAQTTLWAEFLERPRTDGADVPASDIMAYDLRTGRCERRFSDSGNGYGPLYYADDGFYSSRATSGADDEFYWFSADGSEVQRIGEGHIVDVTEDGGIVVTRRYSSEIAIYRNGLSAASWNGGGDFLTYCGHAGANVFFIQNQSETDSDLLMELTADGDTYILGDLPAAGYDYAMASPECEDFLFTAGATPDSPGVVYLLATRYEGTAHSVAERVVVSAVPGRDGSLREVPDTMIFFDDADDSDMYLSVSPDRSVSVMHHEAGEASLSEVSMGDLKLWRTPTQNSVIVSDFLTVSPYADETDEPEVEVFQYGRLVGGCVFVITAKAHRAPEEDIGWRLAYALDGLTYACVPVDDLVTGKALPGGAGTLTTLAER